MPSARALRVIILAKSSSSPPMASAITTAASLAERVTSPLMASSTLMVWPGRRPSLVGACSEACCGHVHFGVELHLAGLEALEQQIKRHDLGQRGGMADAVGIVGRQRRAGIAVDDDGGELPGCSSRARTWCGGDVMAMPVAARIGGVGGEDDCGGDGYKPENAQPAARARKPRLCEA